jgi:hypothetical protein
MDASVIWFESWVASPGARARLFLLLVKSRINVRIRRNCNGLFILNNDHVRIAGGFVRSILAVR